MPVPDLSQSYPLPQQLSERRERLDLAQYSTTTANTQIQPDNFAEWSENNWWRKGWFPQPEDGAKRDRLASPTLQRCPASHGSSGMWVWPPLTLQTQNVWRQPGAHVLHQSCCNWVSTLPCSAKLPADTAGPPWSMWGCPARCIP